MAKIKPIVYRCAAKINLNLDVLSRYPDGYHEIFTTFQAIDLYDTLTFIPTDSGGIEIICDQPGFPTGPENLICRALRLVSEAAGAPGHFRVEVEKRIPIAAGLGGGSANAAATLRAGLDLYNLPLNPAQIDMWAKELGADVPFFLGGAQAEGRERGDQILPVEFFADYWLVLICPPVFLSAGEVYRAIDFPLTSNEIQVSFARCREAEEFFTEAARAHNALSTAVCSVCPEVGDALGVLKERGPVAARVSGSGPCVFGIFREKPDISEMSRELPSAGWKLYLCRPLTGKAVIGLGGRTGECTDR